MISRKSLSSIAKRLNAELFNGDCQFQSVSTDSRAMKAGELFVALKGDNFDAHDYLRQVADSGACGLVVERENRELAIPQLKVADTTLALGGLASSCREDFSGKVAAITGSSGKTTVKGLLANILSCSGKVHATRGNLNNQIGVPLTLLEIEPGNDYLVMELGASAAGEIAYLVNIVQPDVVVVNNVMPAHIEGFGSLEGVAAAKAEIYQPLGKPVKAVVNLDDRFATGWLASLDANSVSTFSLANETADFWAGSVLETENGSQFTLNTPDGSVSVTLGLLGRHNVANALSACACASALGAGIVDMQMGLQSFQAVAGRMKNCAGINGSRIIDDTYNANPGAVRAAIDVLVSQGEQSTFVLGDMGELGPNAAELHRELGEYAKQAGLAQLVTVGDLSAQASEAFGSGARHFPNRESAIDYLKGSVMSGDVILVKGSRSARMENVVVAMTNRGEKQ